MVTTTPNELDTTPGGFEPTPLSENAMVVMERRIMARESRPAGKALRMRALIIPGAFAG